VTAAVISQTSQERDGVVTHNARFNSSVVGDVPEYAVVFTLAWECNYVDQSVCNKYSSSFLILDKESYFVFPESAIVEPPGTYITQYSPSTIMFAVTSTANTTAHLEYYGDSTLQNLFIILEIESFLAEDIRGIGVSSMYPSTSGITSVYTDVPCYLQPDPYKCRVGVISLTLLLADLNRNVTRV